MQKIHRIQIPKHKGGWWHQYVCPVHHIELLPATKKEQQLIFQCPYGCELADGKYHSAWMVFEHQLWARRLWLYAAEYKKNKIADNESHHLFEQALEILIQYAELYTNLAKEWNQDAESWMLRGRLFHQALTEAIWATSLAHGSRTLIEAYKHASLDVFQFCLPFFQQLYHTLSQAKQVLIEERKQFSHNYTAWLNTALISIGWVINKLDPLKPIDTDEYYAGKYGVFNHILSATYKDGWEFEGATYYHVFVLRAYFLSVRGLDWEAVPRAVQERLEKMFAILPSLSTKSGYLPALHDSPFQRPLYDKEILEVMAIGSTLFPKYNDPSISDYARKSLGKEWDGLELHLSNWVENIKNEVGGVGYFKTSILYPDMGYAVFRTKDQSLQAILDFGPHGGPHGHLDKLSLYIYGRNARWQPGFGVPPYGSSLKKNYYCQTASRPTFQINSLEQSETTGECLQWEQDLDGVYGVFYTGGAYANSTAQRHVKALSDYLVDLLIVEGQQDDQIQLNFVPGGEIHISQQDTESTCFKSWWQESGEQLNGYHLCNKESRMDVNFNFGTALDPMHASSIANWKTKGNKAIFLSIWQVHNHGDTRKVESLAMTEVEGYFTIEVMFQNNEKATHHFIKKTLKE